MSRLESRGEHALVLRVGTFREIDCWVRFFSPVRGIETAFAFGGRRSRRRFPGCLDSFNHLRVDLQAPRSGRYLALSEGTLVHRFPNLQRDMRKLGMAVNCIKFLEAAHIGTGPADAVFELVLKALQVLDTGDAIPVTFPLLFRIQLTCLYGYAPDIGSCGLCGRPMPGAGGGAFSWHSGQAVCPDCKDQNSLPGLVDNPDWPRLRGLLQAEPAQWNDYGRPVQGDKRLWQLLDSFVQHHTGLVWDGGRFRRG